MCLKFHIVFGHVDGEVIDDAGISTLHGHIPEFVVFAYDNGEACDVVYPVVVFVILERDLLLRTVHGKWHHEDVVRNHDAYAVPLGKILENDRFHEFLCTGLQFVKGVGVGFAVGPVAHEFDGAPLHSEIVCVCGEFVGGDFKEPVAGDVVVRYELGAWRAAACGDVIRCFVCSHKSRGDVSEVFFAFERGS